MNQLGIYLFLTLVLAFAFLLHWYVFQAIKTATQSIEYPMLRQSLLWLYWIITIGLSLWLFYSILQVRMKGEISNSAQMLSNVMLTMLVTQLVCVLVLLGEDIFRNFRAVFGFLVDTGNGFSFPARSQWVSIMALILATVPLFGFVYGIKYGKYNFKVHKEVLYFEDLPEAFDGFTITQLSDIHAGSLKDKNAVARGVELVMEQQSDLFVFTGDLVNVRADEIDPLIPIFSKIKAPYGQFSILGNHDYGDYTAWNSPEEKVENFESLKNKHGDIGFNLLLDEHVTIEKDGQQLILLGVENWGVGFKAKGDLKKALEGTQSEDFKILLSHDPSHWDAQVLVEDNPIHLTLSGHTHGMQMGIETALVKWSPVQYRYPNWAGLAEEDGKFLYVNRGFGFHAFAGRVGIWPEITVLELRKGKAPKDKRTQYLSKGD